MPLYIFQNPNTDETREVFFKMNDKKEYFGDINEQKVEWKRVFLSPNTSIDTEIDPMDKNSYMRKTENKAGTLGEMWDHSKELSEKRAKKMGKDPIKQEYFKQYKKNHKGVKHYLDK